MVVGEPAQEGEVFRQIGILDRRRMLLELPDRFREPPQHRLPVAHDDRNIGKDIRKPSLDRGLPLFVDVQSSTRTMTLSAIAAPPPARAADASARIADDG